MMTGQLPPGREMKSDAGVDAPRRNIVDEEESPRRRVLSRLPTNTIHKAAGSRCHCHLTCHSFRPSRPCLSYR